MIHIRSCGVIPVVHDHQRWHYLLVQHKNGHWGFPKGHVEKDETPIETALREFHEEVGIRKVSIVPDLTMTDHYPIKTASGRAQKSVVYFLGRVPSRNFRLRQSELLDGHWFDYHTAHLILGKMSTGRILRKAHAFVLQHTWT